MIETIAVTILTSGWFWGIVASGLASGVAYLQKRKVNGLVLDVLSQAGQNIVQQVEKDIVVPAKLVNGTQDVYQQRLAMEEAKRRFIQILEETGIKIAKDNLAPLAEAMVHNAGIKLGLIHDPLPQGALDIVAAERAKAGVK